MLLQTTPVCLTEASPHLQVWGIRHLTRQVQTKEVLRQQLIFGLVSLAFSFGSVQVSKYLQDWTVHLTQRLPCDGYDTGLVLELQHKVMAFRPSSP